MSFQEIIILLTAYKYFFLFPVVIVEGPIITVIAGFLSSLGILNIFIAYAVVVAGDIVGDSLYYSLGYYGRQEFIGRWGRFLWITPERVKHLEKHFKKHSGKTLMFGKLSHAIGGVVLVAAGASKMPFRKFIWYTFLPTLPKSLIFLLIGFYFGEAYRQIDGYFSYATLCIFFATILVAAVYFFSKKFKKKIN